MEDVKVEYSCQDESNATPLHYAAFSGRLPVVKLLVEEYHCNPDVIDNSKHTPADVAQQNGFTDISLYLLSIEKIVSSECN